MGKRRYIVTFRCKTEYADKYALLLGTDKDNAYMQACALYGFMNVGGIYLDDDYTRAVIRMRKLECLA